MFQQLLLLVFRRYNLLLAPDGKCVLLSQSFNSVVHFPSRTDLMRQRKIGEDY